MPELPGNLGLRSRARRAALRLLWFIGACSIRTDEGADPAGEPARVQDPGDGSPGQSPRLVWVAMVRAECAEIARADGYRARTLHPVLDLRRTSACGVDRRVRLPLLRNAKLHRLAGAFANAAGSKDSLGPKRRRARP